MKTVYRLLLALLLLLTGIPAFAQSGKGQWCGYALIEGLDGIEYQLPMLSLIVPEEKADSDPSDLFQYRVSLDGTKAIIEGCWKIFPSRQVIVNLIGLNVRDDSKDTVDQMITYSLFAPDGSREDSAASVREYMSKTIREWELPDEDLDGAATK